MKVKTFEEYAGKRVSLEDMPTFSHEDPLTLIRPATAQYHWAVNDYLAYLYRKAKRAK